MRLEYKLLQQNLIEYNFLLLFCQQNIFLLFSLFFSLPPLYGPILDCVNILF